MKRDYSVSFARVTAMIMIILCHTMNYFKQVALAQFLNVGVTMFFIISGYLYSGRQITDKKEWLLKRLIRLYMPLLAYIIIHMASLWISGRALPPLYEWIMLFLNLQGLNRWLCFVPDVTGPWFFTSIMFCYFAVILIKDMEAKYTPTRRQYIFAGGGGILLLSILLNFTGLFSIGNLFSFLIGYIYGKTADSNDYLRVNKWKKAAVLALCFSAAVAVRLAGKFYLEDYRIYEALICYVTHQVIGFCIFLGCIWLYKNFRIISKITESGLFQHLDKISVYVYVSHAWLYNGILMRIFEYGLPLWFATVLFAVLIVLLATVLYWIFDRCGRMIERKLITL